MNAKQLTNTLTIAVQNGLPILIKGAPGVGKSDVVAQAAKAAKMELIISHPVVSDPTDFKGLPGIVDGEAEFLAFGDLRCILEGNVKKPTIMFLDDLGQAPAVVQAAAMQLILARKVNGHKVDDKVVFVAATNRREDRAGVSSILEPVKSRFASIIELDPDIDSWVEWAMKNKMPAELIGYLRFCPGDLLAGEATADIINRPCPRTWAFAGKLLQAGLDTVEIISGCIGEGYASKFVGFLRVAKGLPDIDDVIDDPDNAMVPKEPSAKYAVVAALIERMKKNNIANIMRYGKRLPAEFHTLLIRDMVRKQPRVQETEAFIEWAMEHKDILL